MYSLCLWLRHLVPEICKRINESILFFCFACVLPVHVQINQMKNVHYFEKFKISEILETFKSGITIVYKTTEIVKRSRIVNATVLLQYGTVR